jgi:glycosyltransferase involved in cell wall biosynthesis
MKVLLATHFFPPTQMGGTESYTLGLAKALRRRGHEPFGISAGTIEAPHGAPPTIGDEWYDGLPIRRISWNWQDETDPFRSFYDNPWIADLVAEHARSIKADVVHITSCYSLGAGILKAVREAGCRIVLTLTDFWFLCSRHTLLRGDGQLCQGPRSALDCQRCLASGSGSLRSIMRVLPPKLVAQGLLALTHWPAATRMSGLRGYIGDATSRQEYLKDALLEPDVVIAPSRFLRDMFVSNGYPSERFQVSPYGLDLSWGPRRELRRSDDTLVLGYFGQIEPIKGVDVAIRAISAIDRSVPVKLRIFGPMDKNPAYAAYLHNLAGADDRIEFLGAFTRETLGASLATVDAAVVPSMWYENTPLVISEAFSALRPVLATDLGGLSEAVEHGVNGLLFQRGDYDGLAQAIQRLVHEPGLLNRLRAGIGPVRTIEDEVDEIIGFYRGVRPLAQVI